MTIARRILMIAICSLCLITNSAIAKHRDWQEWKLVSIQTVKSDKQFIAPIFGIWIAGSLPDTTVLIVQNQKHCYALTPKKDKPLNFTTNSTVKMATQELKAWIIDDAGKEVEFRIAGKHVRETDQPCHLK